MFYIALIRLVKFNVVLGCVSGNLNKSHRTCTVLQFISAEAIVLIAKRTGIRLKCFYKILKFSKLKKKKKTKDWRSKGHLFPEAH